METEDTILLGSSAPEEDERKHQESDREDDLGPGKPKSRFSVEGDRHEIQTNDHNKHDGDPNYDVEVVVPVVDDQASSGDFGGLLVSWKLEGCQACFASYGTKMPRAYQYR